MLESASRAEPYLRPRLLSRRGDVCSRSLAYSPRRGAGQSEEGGATAEHRDRAQVEGVRGVFGRKFPPSLEAVLTQTFFYC